MGKSVFISHAVKDKALAAEIVTLIEEGIGVPEGEIFCSSLQGYGIPTGKNFVTFIKEQMLEPKVVVLLLTPAYFESQFCVSELGAAWIKSHAIFPILVPPLKHSDVKAVLLGTQVINIEDDIGYNELLETLRSEVECTPKSQTKWDTKRRAFLKALESLLPKVDAPSHVTADEYGKVINQLDEAQAELDVSEEEIRALKKRLAAIAALKDKAEVAAVEGEFAPDDAEDLKPEYDRLLKDVAGYRGKFGNAVFMFVLCQHYHLPYTIEQEDDSQFEAAARRKYIDLEQGADVLWSNPTMKGLSHALGAVEDFVRANQRELEELVPDEPLDPGVQDFWEEHYGL